jgi:Sec-independent protein secretion pathway component TatC
MADPASPGDDDADSREEDPAEAPESDADGENVDRRSAEDESPDADGFEGIPGIGPAKARALREAGFESAADLRAATPEELSAARGVGETLAGQIKNEVGGAAGSDPDTEDSGSADGDDDADDSGSADGDDDADDSGSADGDDDADEDDISDDDLARVGNEIEGDANEVEPVQEDGGGGLLGYGQAGGPNADEEMPLTEHIEEMLKRLVVVAVVAGVVSVVTFPFTDVLVNFLWNSILPTGPDTEFARPRLYNVLEFWFTKVKVASLAGVIIALPVFVYQTYRFMRPGLYPNERRYYLAAVPTSLVLALVGVAFAYFIVLPSVFTYFLFYSQDVTTIGFALGRTFNLILIMMGYLAIVFQIPLFILLAMLMGLVTRQWLADRRLIFWGAFLGISFVFSPDPTGMVPIMITLTMIALFEGTLLLTRWTRGPGGDGERGIGA